jgi:hypothetical protein
VQQAAMTEMPDKADLGDLYLWLSRAYDLSGQTEKTLATDVEKDRLGYGN